MEKSFITDNMSFKQFLSEMPITNLNRLGDWNPAANRQYGFDRKDAGIIGSDKGIEKIKRMWSNSKENFDVYFVRQKNAWKHIEVGEVSTEWVQKNLGMDIKPNEEAITIIFTNNRGAEKIPMTAWTIAHRLGHAIRWDETFDRYFAKEIEQDFRNILNKIYAYQKSQNNYYSQNSYNSDEKMLRALAHAVGTMQSARQRNLRNFFEFAYELVAQYIITGKIKFNPIPQNLIIQNGMAWGKPVSKIRNSQVDLTDWNEMLQGYADKYEYYLDSIFMGLIGRIFVM